MVNRKGLGRLRVRCLDISRLGVERLIVERLNVKRPSKYELSEHRLGKEFPSILLYSHGFGEGIPNKVLCFNLCSLCGMVSLEWRDIMLKSISLAILWVHSSLHGSNLIPDSSPL